MGRPLSLVLSFALTVAISHLRAQAPPQGTGSWSVDSPVRVIEGDTLEVRIDGRRIGVLIAGIVAPQGNTACGRRAITTTQALVEGGITLHEDLTLPPFDRRLLRVYRVFDAMGRLVAAELARAGLAVPADGMSNGVDRPAIAAAAAEAAANRRTCVTPSHR